MILYCYECMDCGKEFEDYKEVQCREWSFCPGCYGVARQIIKLSNPQDWFRPHWNEHLDPDKPIFVKSKNHYKSLCKQYGVQARCL